LQNGIAIVAMGASNVTDPNQFAHADSFAAAMKISKCSGSTSTSGHFTAANFDPVAYVREHHASITNLHLKDRHGSGRERFLGRGRDADPRCCSSSGMRPIPIRKLSIREGDAGQNQRAGVRRIS
jgi:sugar phosphate isomerase/epimerase